MKDFTQLLESIGTSAHLLQKLAVSDGKLMVR